MMLATYAQRWYFAHQCIMGKNYSARIAVW